LKEFIRSKGTLHPYFLFKDCRDRQFIRHRPVLPYPSQLRKYSG